MPETITKEQAEAVERFIDKYATEEQKAERQARIEKDAQSNEYPGCPNCDRFDKLLNNAMEHIEMVNLAVKRFIDSRPPEEPKRQTFWQWITRKNPA